MVWKDKVFWSLAVGGLVAYLFVFLVGPKALVVGSVLWILALVYLAASSIEKWAKCRKETT